MNKLARHTSLNQALAIHPDDPQIWYYKGIALLELNRNKDAVESYNKALAINLDFTEVKEKRDKVLGRKKRNSEARGE